MGRTQVGGRSRFVAPQAGEWTARSRRTNQPKKGSRCAYKYVHVHVYALCVCVCVGAGTYARVLVTVSPEENNAYFRFYLPTL